MESIVGFRLSPRQRHLWSLLQEGAPRTAAAVFRLRGPLDAPALRAAVEALVARHEVLRTSFERLPGMPEALQVAGEASVRWEEAAGAEALRDGAGEGPLPAARLVRTGDGEHLLRLDVHALAVDEASFEHLARDLAALYAAERGGPEVEDEPVPYLAVSEWLNEVAASEEAQAGRAHWARQREGEEPVLAVEREAASGDGSAHRALAATTAARLAAFAAGRGVPADTVLLAGWKALLHRLAREGVARVSVAADGRADEELRHAVGPFTEHLPVAAAFGADTPFAGLVERVREALDDAAAWHECFERSEGAAAPRVGFGAAPEAAAHAGGGIEVRVERRRAAEEPFALYLRVERRGAETALELRGGGGFPPEQLPLLLERLEALLDAALVRPETPVGELPARSPAETARLLEAFNRTAARSEPSGWTAHALFEAQAARTPGAPAARFGAETLSYAELNARANRRARHLRSLGVGPESRVGIMLPSSPLRLETLLAVLKAGGAWVPLDPAYPQERLAFMVRDAGLSLVLTDSALRGRFPADGGAVAVAWDEVEAAVAALPDGDLGLPLHPASAAYVIYTSGSTGTPKGVLVEHRALAVHALSARAHYGLGEGDRVLQFASFSFDPTVEQTLAPLVGGACVVLREEALAGVEALGRYVEDGITVLNLPTAQWQLLAAAWARGEAVPDLGRLRLVIAGGEAMPPSAVALWRDTPARGARLLNAYGPTEAVVTAATFAVPAGFGAEGRPRVPIGRPFGNRTAYVLDAGLEPAPLGAPGELFLGGEALARGYLGRPAATAERFVPDPFAGVAGARMYRTGDRARHHENGALEFLGREDGQLKVRGFRIEPGEVEAALERHPDVARSAVVLEEKGGGERQLAAYWVPRGDALPDAAALRAHLRERLPDYMVPGVFVALATMPLSAVGKVDRGRLAGERRLGAERPVVPPSTPTEAQVAAIWAEVMKQERVSMDDNFFAVGGHSLLATQLTSRLRRHFAVDLQIGRVFDAATVADLARVVDELAGARPEGEEAEEAIGRAARGRRVRASELAALLDP